MHRSVLCIASTYMDLVLHAQECTLHRMHMTGLYTASTKTDSVLHVHEGTSHCMHIDVNFTSVTLSNNDNSPAFCCHMLWQWCTAAGYLRAASYFAYHWRHSLGHSGGCVSCKPRIIISCCHQSKVMLHSASQTMYASAQHRRVEYTQVVKDAPSCILQTSYGVICIYHMHLSLAGKDCRARVHCLSVPHFKQRFSVQEQKLS